VVRANQLKAELYQELGDINLGSNPQVLRALQTKGILGTRKTKSGKDSVSDESLKPLKNPTTDKLLRWRSEQKTLSTYVPAFRAIDHKGRIHTNFGYTETGRFKSRQPNLQNLTKNDKFVEDAE
jgi:DNA polymerase I-like protein with 3'-5' exonuclease and polymerase domains